MKGRMLVKKQLTKSCIQRVGGIIAPLTVAMMILGACPGQVQAARSLAPEAAASAAGPAGTEIVRSLQQKGTDPANFKLAEVDADIVLDTVALMVGPEDR